MDNKKRTSPRDDIEKAWRVLANPSRFTKMDLSDLYTRGIENHYPSEEDFANQKKILEDASRFAMLALDHRHDGGEPLTTDDLELREEFIESPGRLQVVASFASLLSRRHRDIKKQSRPVEIHEHSRKRLLDYIQRALVGSENKGVINFEIGQLTLSRDQEDDLGPPPGRTVEEVVMMEEDSEMAHFKVPLAQAKTDLIVRNDDGNIRSLIGEQYEAGKDDKTAGPFIYVPMDYAWKLYSRYFFKGGSVPQTHETAVKGHIHNAEDHLERMQGAMIGFNKEISKRIEHNNDGGIFKPRRYDPLLKTILEAIDHLPPEKVKFGEEYTAEKVKQIVIEYAKESDQDWVQSIANGIGNPRSFGRRLANIGRDDGGDHINVHRDGRKYTYSFQYTKGNFKRVSVTEIEDVIELPCMQNLHDHLLKTRPVRWDLYSFARYLMEIETLDLTLEDVTDWFSQYPWYRPAETKYQFNYELDQEIQGERPMPISCNNDNQRWSEYCIGKENCDYSLYQSIELKEDVYERLDDEF